MCYRGEVLKARGGGVSTNRSDGYWVSYCVVSMEYSLRERDECQVGVRLDWELCHQSVYRHRGCARGVRLGEGSRGHEDEHGARWWEH